MELISRLLARLVPAVMLAGGVTLLMSGLLAFTPVTGGVDGPGRTPGAGDPVLTPGSLPPAPASPAPPTEVPPLPDYLPGPDSPATARPSPPPPASEQPVAVASRIVIRSLRVDLPIVSSDLDVPGNRDNYPLCDVAHYWTIFVQPGQEGTTYIYAHAQQGMFLPLLRASRRDDGQDMIGALVEVYTNDSRLHLYEIFQVKRHATDLSLAYEIEAGEQQLVLQTSEGPEGTIPKLQVAARAIGELPATPEEALPEPEPRACPPPR